MREFMLPSWEAFDFGPDAWHVSGELIKHQCCGIQRAISLGHPNDRPVETCSEGELKHDHGMGLPGARDPTNVHKLGACRDLQAYREETSDIIVAWCSGSSPQQLELFVTMLSNFGL